MSVLEARRYMAAAAPRVAQAHLVESNHGGHLFVVDGSRLFDADASLFEQYRQAFGRSANGEIDVMLRDVGLLGDPFIDDVPLASPPLHAISLAVAQKCNLGCTYCYAQEGQFGRPAANMALSQAKKAIDLLIDNAASGAKLNIAFLGGEPLANRPVLRAATEYAVESGERRGVSLSFSITTNGTLLTLADADFFEAHGFAVTVSIDGLREQHDAQRPYKNGRGSYDAVMRRIEPLLANQRRMQVTARVTVTPKNLELSSALDELIDMGFHSVGFSPMLSSPTHQGEMRADDLEVMLGQMIACGRRYEDAVARGLRYPFANMSNAMREIEKGTHRPYPCGAGAGYLGVAADGALSACHRFVGDDVGAMGSVESGVDKGLQADWLSRRHVHRQEPCQSCWARYLCAGGCHHEVINRGRPACDYIRGWLHYCLEAYLRLSTPSITPSS